MAELKKYKSRHYEAEAIQWQPGVTVPGVEIEEAGRTGIVAGEVVCPGDYIVRDAQGRVSVKTAKWFETLYATVEPEPVAEGGEPTSLHIDGPCPVVDESLAPTEAEAEAVPTPEPEPEPATVPTKGGRARK